MLTYAQQEIKAPAAAIEGANVIFSKLMIDWDYDGDTDLVLVWELSGIATVQIYSLKKGMELFSYRLAGETTGSISDIIDAVTTDSERKLIIANTVFVPQKLLSKKKLD